LPAVGYYLSAAGLVTLIAMLLLGSASLSRKEAA
jgi:hypothetical protein